MTTRRKILFYAVPLIVLTGITSCSVSAMLRAQDMHRKADADRVAVELERDGWRASAESSQREMSEVVAGLEEQLAAARAAGATPVLVSRVTTGDATWRVPTCEPSPAGEPVALLPGTASPGATPVPVPSAGEDCPPGDPGCLAVRARIETAVVVDPAGRPSLRTLAWATPRLGQWQGTERALPEGDVEVAHDPVLSTALDRYFAAQSERRLDLLVGGSLSADSWGLAAGAAGGGRRFGWWALGEWSRRDPGDGYVEVGDGYYARQGAASETELRALGGVRVSMR